MDTEVAEPYVLHHLFSFLDFSIFSKIGSL